MARELTFKAGNEEYQANPTVIDRKQLYGWTENLAFDDDGGECKLITMDESDALIPKGGTGLGILSPDGKWVERTALKTVKLDGTPADLLPSSYNAPIELTEKVDEDEFLNHSISAFYQLDNVNAALIEWIGNDIYRFDYCYRDSYEGKPAFLLVAEDAEKNQKLFMLLGIRNEIEMLNLQQTSYIEDNTEQEEEDDSDDIDFSMF